MSLPKSLPAQNPKVAVVLVNYKGAADTIACVQSLLSLEFALFQIFIVDNCSPDGSFTQLKQWLRNFTPPHYTSAVSGQDCFPFFYALEKNYHSHAPTEYKKAKVILLKAPANNGFAAGNNIGILFARKLGADLFWILNNDTIVKPDSLTQLVSCFQELQDQKIGIVGSQLRYLHQKNTIQALGGKYSPYFGLTSHLRVGESADRLVLPKVSFESDYAIGASMLVSGQFIANVGLMEEKYFLYFEELDWHLRGVKKGWKHAICTTSIVYHKEGASIGTGSGDARSELSDLCYLKSKITFTKKFYPQYLPLVYASYIAVIGNRIKRGQFKRAIKVVKMLIGSPTP